MDIREQSAGQLVGHTLSVGTLVSVITGLLPVAASLVALVWYVIQIFESDTWCGRVERRRIRRIAKLRGELAMLEALMETTSRPTKKRGRADECAGAAAER